MMYLKAGTRLECNLRHLVTLYRAYIKNRAQITYYFSLQQRNVD